MSTYTNLGYESRRDYLQHLAREYEVDYDIVFTLAYALGPIEDFDGLINALQDYTPYEYFSGDFE